MDDPVAAASTPSKKRTRKPNWTMDESLYLLQLYRDHARVLRQSFSDDGCTHQTKQKAWEDIRSKLQQAFPAGQRTTKECQKRWHTILVTARSKLSQVRKDFAATGGGSPHPPIDPLEELVADILGKENVTITGIAGAPSLHDDPLEGTSSSVCMSELTSHAETGPASLLEGATQDLPALFAAAAEVISSVPAPSAPATEVTSVLLPSASEDGTVFIAR
ncbi:uncharacterized protein LOC126995092 [Eriocheir sinensis]|uniref:uncharacterized protein LOC126995092 n=1 Tax=Eriocheir sinensis TaxID=95602 RepID=UPI0021C5CA95|nr:uncharacterized protein LOC126995092 [Eriocheir sinensis]